MHLRLLCFLSAAVFGSVSPADDEFFFDFQSPHPTNTQHDSGADADDYVWPTYMGLSDLEWLEIGFGQDLWNPIESFEEENPVYMGPQILQESPETTVVVPSNSNPSMSKSDSQSETSVSSPSKRPRGRPPKSAAAKSSTTTKPSRAIGKPRQAMAPTVSV